MKLLTCPRLNAVILLLATAPAFAQLKAPSSLTCGAASLCELQVYIENDSFGAGTDRYYTNGIKIGGGMKADPLLERILQRPAEKVLNEVASIADSAQFGFFVGQHMYTPRRITQGAPQPFDRPWAGWLYLGGVAQGVLGNRLHTVEINIGVVGPLAQAKLAQTEWHKLVGADTPQGWHNQLKNEPGILLAYVGKWRLGPDTGVQLIPHFGVTLGNVMTLARAGGVLRVGQNMKGFGPDTIEPGGAMLQRDLGGTNSSRRDWNVFAGVDARVVARNIFLDGNTFRNGPSVDSRTFVYDLKTGVSARFAPFHISVTRIRRSEEFSTLAGGGGQQKFYSVNLSWEF
jgi:hypothetical protein